MADEVKQNAPEFSGRVKAATQMDTILRDVQANEKRVKKARAEVLAACAQRGFDAAIEEGPPAQVEDTAAYIRDEILKLQPAAKHLEELLEKAQEKGWNEAIEIAIKWNELSFSQDSFTKWMNIQRIEKARAFLEEKSCTNGQPG